jgi:hypothetical protein
MRILGLMKMRTVKVFGALMVMTASALVLPLQSLAAHSAAASAPRIAFGDGTISVGSYRIWGGDVLPTYAGAIRAFGTPSSCAFARSATDAIVRWRHLGITAEFTTLGAPPNGGDACSEPAAFELDHLVVTGKTITTREGLRVGDPAAKVGKLYPHALPHNSTWWMVIEKNVIGSTFLYPVVSATIDHGRVSSFVFKIGAEGD